MKNRNIKSVAIVIMATVMLTGLNAQAQRRGGQGKAPHGHQVSQKHAGMAIHHSLDLSTEQQEQLKSLKMTHYKTMKPLKYKMVELKAKERTLLSEESVDLKEINGLIDEQTDLTNKIKKLHVAHQVETKNILTDEQVMKMELRRKVVKHKKAQHLRGVSQKQLRQRKMG